MKVCFFNRSYYPDQGATGQLLTELAESLVRDHGCSVTVVAGLPVSPAEGSGPLPAGFPWSRETRGGVEILRAWGTAFRPARFAGRAANYLSYFLSAFFASFAVRKPAAVVSLTDPPIIGLLAYLTARRTGGKFVFLCEDVFPEAAALLNDFRNAWVERLLQKINRFLVQKADRIVALGDAMRELLVRTKGADPGKITVIHNWADCSLIVPGPKQNPFSEVHGLAGRFVVMHSGNLGGAQDLDILLRAADCLKDMPDVLFLIVGKGTRKEQLQAEAARMKLENVRFLPPQPKEKLSESFSSADCFVISSRPGLAGVVMPSKLYGILAAGRGYVAAVDEACDVARVTRRWESGLLCRAGDAVDLADKIRMLYNDRELARRLGENARRAAPEFDRSKSVGAYYSMLRELTGMP